MFQGHPSPPADDRLVIERGRRLLAIFEDAQRAVQALAAEGVELGIEKR